MRLPVPSAPRRRTAVSALSTLSIGILTMLSLSLTRCGGGINTEPDLGIGPATGIYIVPDNDVLLVDLNQKATKDFRVLATLATGEMADVTASATVQSDNPAVGTLRGATFETTAQSAVKIDTAHITASYTDSKGTYTGRANLTVVWLRQSGTTTDFFFNLPYNGGAKRQILSFGTNIQSIDSFFAVDTTGSMAAEITTLRDSLQGTVIPGIKKAAARDAWFGVGAIEDFQVVPFGEPSCPATRGTPGVPDDQPFILLSPMTSDVAAAQNAVGKLLAGSNTRGCGGDVPEGHMEALYQIATGVGNVVPNVVNIPAHTGKGRGGVEFRAGALPVITVITDAAFHVKGETGRTCTYKDSGGTTFNEPTLYSGAALTAAHTRAETVAALKNLCAKVIGVSAQLPNYPDACLGNSDLVQMAKDSGARVPPEVWDQGGRPSGCATGQCCTGLNGTGEAPDSDGLCSLVFKITPDGKGLDQRVVSGITQLAQYASFDVTTSKSGSATGDGGVTLPAGRTSADFIRMVAPDSAVPAPGAPQPVISGSTFTKVTPGTTVRFNIDAANDFQPAIDRPQVFRATIKVQASGCADLDSREVIFLIPPKAPIIG
ncbi:MAG: hypothetical protein U1A78_16195 [Polyangia bacterium]